MGDQLFLPLPLPELPLPELPFPLPELPLPLPGLSLPLSLPRGAADEVVAPAAASDVVEVGCRVVLVDATAAPTRRVVVVERFFLPQSLFAASARLCLGWEDTYSPWLRAFSQVTATRAFDAAELPGLVVVVLVVDVLAWAGMTTTATTVELVCALADPALRPSGATRTIDRDATTERRFMVSSKLGWTQPTPTRHLTIDGKCEDHVSELP